MEESKSKTAREHKHENGPGRYLKREEKIPYHIEELTLERMVE